jgi:hypothetical protein
MATLRAITQRDDVDDKNKGGRAKDEAIGEFSEIHLLF